MLYWDSNAPVDRQNWLTEWQSDLKTFETFPLPASVYIRLTLYADDRPRGIIADGEPVQTIVLETMVNIESVIDNEDFARPSL